MDRNNDRPDAAFWLGFTFDFPAYAGVPGVLPAHNAGRGLCVARHGGLTLRLDDGSHVAVMVHDARLVTEIPRVEPPKAAEVKYETAVIYRDVGEKYEPARDWEVVTVTPVGPTRGTNTTSGINQVAITLRRKL